MPNYVFRSRLAVKRGKQRGKIVNRIARSRAVKSSHWKYGGHGYIAGEGTGIVTVGGQPASRRIYLFARPNMYCIADTWSAEDGSYRFDRLKEDELGFVFQVQHYGTSGWNRFKNKTLGVS